MPNFGWAYVQDLGTGSSSTLTGTANTITYFDSSGSATGSTDYQITSLGPYTGINTTLIEAGLFLPDTGSILGTQMIVSGAADGSTVYQISVNEVDIDIDQLISFNSAGGVSVSFDHTSGISLSASQNNFQGQALTGTYDFLTYNINTRADYYYDVLTSEYNVGNLATLNEYSGYLWRNTTTGSATGSILPGNIITLSGTIWTLASAEGTGSNPAYNGTLAIARDSNPSTGSVFYHGVYHLGSTRWSGSFEPGKPVYLSLTPGEFTSNPPTGSGQIVRIVGQALVENYVIYFNPSNDWIEI